MTKDELVAPLARSIASQLGDDYDHAFVNDALRFKRLWKIERASLRERSDEACGLEYRLGEAEAERDRLAAMVEKLRGYAVHDDDCGVNALLMPRLPLTKQCTCGLSAVLQEIRP